MNAVFMQRQQAHWDWRAAANFICGGAGAGLLAFTAFAIVEPLARLLLVAAGLGLVGLGLFCVWLEIGRPLRAMNVFVNLRGSWMSREAVAAGVLFLLGAGALPGMGWPTWPLALAALVFLYCQARIVAGARGIPAWREPMTVPLLVATGLAEGAGLFWVACAWHSPGAPAALALAFGVLVAARWGLWHMWRTRLGASAPAAALRVIDRNGKMLRYLGGALPLVLIALAASRALPQPLATALLAVAGALVAATGASFKGVLITCAGHMNGFALPHLPVRGVPR